jgi:hypothetical protein
MQNQNIQTNTRHLAITTGRSTSPRSKRLYFPLLFWRQLQTPHNNPPSEPPAAETQMDMADAAVETIVIVSQKIQATMA